MELIYERDSNRSCDDTKKTRALTTLDIPRQVSMIRELNDQRRKLAQKASRTSHIYDMPTFNRFSTYSETEEIAKYFKMAPLIPDEVIKNADNYEVRAFGAAVIFADISGFTELSDRYQQVENGASKLSTVLNFYLGIMVQEILIHNGDVLKYAGDAFLAMFKVDKSTSYQTAVQNAIDTSIIIQKSCQNFKTEIGIILNVKIAISCGEIHFSTIGDENLSHYVVVGEPIFQVKFLQDHISPGEILITQNAWFFIAENLYTYQIFRELRCYKITGFRDQINAIRQQYEAINLQEKSAFAKTEASETNLTFISESNFNFNNLSFEAHTYSAFQVSEERFAVRQTINVTSIADTRKSLRRFIILPLLNAIDMGESIETLTEMRSVVIVFANFVLPEKDAVQICKITDKIFTQLNNIVTSFQGTLNKVSLFDKDMMFLSIFGLRGQKHENECEVGLRCAHEILETFKSWSEISVVSIGVTSGTCYCGIVGHTLRREYSVISVTVNKAARLMMAYPGIVSCDEDTFIRSKMNFLRHFKKLPWRRLKGLQEAVRAYEFVGFEEMSVIDEFETREPMSGRKEVMEKAHQCVIAAIEAFNSNDSVSTPWCFMIKGDGQQGKTRVINELYYDCVHQNLKCLRLILNAKHTSMRFWTLKYCLAKILEHENGNGNIQEIIADKFSDLSVDGEYMSALNSIFDTHFPSHNATPPLDGIRKLVFRILCHHLSSHFWIIFIDDADYIDADSLELLPTVFEARNVFFVLTIGKYCRKWTLAQKEIYVNEFVTQFRLQPIDKTFHKDIACQSINVAAIPIEFERFIHENSNGNPGWIENCASALLYAGKLRRQSMMIKEAIANGMILMNDLIKQNAMIENSDGELEVEVDDIFYDVSNIPRKSLVEKTLKDISDDEKIIYVAHLTSKLTAKDFAGKHTTRKLMLYDSLSSHDQLVCKCAALLGNEFPRDMLNYLLPSCKERKIVKTIVQLFQNAILKCASTRAPSMREEKVRKFSDTINCYCKATKMPESCRDLPKYGNCASIKFQDEAFRKYIYETLTEKQRLEFHKRCITYLFFNTKKCKNCKHERFEIIDEFELSGRDGIVQRGASRCDNGKQMNENLFKILQLFVDDVKSTQSHKQPPIVLNFINHNFNQCSCTSILYSVFSKITQHCYGDEMKIKLLYSQVILADICIKLSNTPRAMMLLDECLAELNGIKDKTNMYDNNSHFITFLRGRVLMLRGICSKKMLQYDDALRYYLAAGDIFQISLPRKFNLAARCKLLHVRHVIKNSTNQYHRKLSRVDSLITEQCSLLIQLLYELYMTMDDFKMAKLAAFWSLKKALKSGTKVGRIAMCFANVMHICIITNDIGESFDVQALNEVLRSISGDGIDAETLDSVVKMYAKIMQWNFLKNKVALAIRVGEIAKKISYNLPTYLNLLEIIPIQLLLLIKSLRIDDANKLLTEFGGIVKFNRDRSGIIWFYALAMDLILDTCHAIVSYEECYQFHLELVTSSNHGDVNDEAMERFFANFWLWSMRNDMLERGERLMERLRARFELNSHSSINDVMTGIRIVEALTLHYLRAVECKNIPVHVWLHYQITRYLNILKNDVKSTFRCFEERLLLHELHFETMINQKHSKLLQLQMGMMMKKAQMKEDFFAFNYLRHLRMTFARQCENVKNRWKELNMKNSSNSQQRIVFFTLPMIINEN